jgi:hypothetical protein
VAEFSAASLLYTRPRQRSRLGRANVPMITGTNTDLGAAARAETVHEDVLFRLRVVPLEAPSLVTEIDRTYASNARAPLRPTSPSVRAAPCVLRAEWARMA